MFRYEIYIEPLNYIAVLNDSNAGIVWELDDNGVIFRKRLDGQFSFNRSGNEPLYDKLMSLRFCEECILTCYNDSGQVIQGSFSKKALTISEDKCLINLKFDRVDEYTVLDGIMDKDVNVLKLDIPVKTVISIDLPQIEYTRYTANLVSDSYWTADYGGGFRWIGDGKANPIIPYSSSAAPTVSMWAGWTISLELAQYTLQQNYYKYVGPSGAFNSIFTVTSFYSRQVIYVSRLGDEQSATPSNTGDPCDKYAWVFDSYDPLTKQDKFARKMEITHFVENPYPPSPDQYAVIMYSGYYESACYSETHKYTRCRRLNDVIKAFISPYFTDFESEFFKNTVNPISGKDLTNILISQKSDCIGTTSDPAIKGILTLQRLLTLLMNEFNVRWGIDKEGKFRIEHIKYWNNNKTYDTPTEQESVGINLVAEYPVALNGSNEYTFEDKLPIREKFSFMESWRIDFVGMDIDYSDCIKVGDSLSYSAGEVTTDIDPTLLLGYASKEGFCMFHCDSVANNDGSYNVISEMGKLSNMILENVHLSWANLHDAYWKYDRYLPSGIMNGKETEFDVRPLKYQVPISFPYCVGDFDPQRLIRTYLGDGAVKTAKFSFKTNWMTVELQYIDTI